LYNGDAENRANRVSLIKQKQRQMNGKIKLAVALTCLLLAATIMSSCRKQPTVTEIVLKTPDNNTEIDLSNIETLTFRWVKVADVSAYTLKFALHRKDLANTEARIDVGNTDSYSPNLIEFDRMLSEKLQIWAGESITLYWTVTPTQENAESTTYIRNMQVIRLPHELSLEAMHFNATPERRTQSLEIDFAGAWTVSSMENGHWLNITPTSGNGKQRIIFSAAQNTGAARSTRVTISSAGTEDKDITVMQDAAGVIKLLSKAYLAGKLSSEYEYDSYNRISKITDYDTNSQEETNPVRTYKIEYSPMRITETNAGIEVAVHDVYKFGEGLLCLSTRKTDGEITIDTLYYVPTLNYYNLPESIRLRRASNVFEYDGTGNISRKYSAYTTGFKYPSRTEEEIKQGEIEGTVDMAEYEYDNKKSPFYSCTSPKWFILLICNYNEIFNNYVTVTYNNEQAHSFTHEYDDNNYVIRNIQRNATYEYLTK
jgi:hypothetical protein